MESKYVRPSAGSDVGFCLKTFYSERNKTEVGLSLILRLLQCCSSHWLRCSATSFRVNVWHCSLFLCSRRKRYKKKSHTIIIAYEAFVTYPNWRTPGYRNIYVQNLSVHRLGYICAQVNLLNLESCHKNVTVLCSWVLREVELLTAAHNWHHTWRPSVAQIIEQC
jgi:hypothetical protein